MYIWDQTAKIIISSYIIISISLGPKILFIISMLHSGTSCPAPFCWAWALKSVVTSGLCVYLSAACLHAKLDIPLVNDSRRSLSVLSDTAKSLWFTEVFSSSSSPQVMELRSQGSHPQGWSAQSWGHWACSLSMRGVDCSLFRTSGAGVNCSLVFALSLFTFSVPIRIVTFRFLK